jgi:uncharacterized protein DUF3617
MATRNFAPLRAAVVLTLCAPPAGAVELSPGLYEITVKTELPHLENSVAPTVVDRCVTESAIRADALPVVPMGEQFRDCAAADWSRQGDTLTYRLACPGPDAPRGSARFQIAASGFEGAIYIQMGGKNMTMVQRHSGRRTGDCPLR